MPGSEWACATVIIQQVHCGHLTLQIVSGRGTHTVTLDAYPTTGRAGEQASSQESRTMSTGRWLAQGLGGDGGTQ